MKYYFDIRETFTKTVSVEADNLLSAEQMVQKLYHNDDINIDYSHPDDVDFKNIEEGQLLEVEYIDTVGSNIKLDDTN